MGGRRPSRSRRPKSGPPLPSPPVLPAWQPARAIVALVLAGFAVLFVSLEYGSYTQQSATWDEPGHLAAGYAALARSDYRLDIEHPPLVRMWAALPLTFMKVNTGSLEVDAAKPEQVAFDGPFDLAHRFLYRDNDADRLLYRARFMIVLLGVLLGVLLFAWTAEWLGFRAAAIALALYVTEPNIAAHAGLVTTDLGVTCFFFGTVYFLWRSSRRPSVWNAGACLLCFVCAVLSKFSGLVLIPVAVLLMAIVALRRGRLTLKSAIAMLGASIAAVWLGSWAAYGFRFAPSATPGWLFDLQHQPSVVFAVPRWSALVAWLDGYRLLPNALTQGFLHAQGLALGRPAFLWGSYSPFGWWYYFPVAFLLKTGVSLLALFAGGLAVQARRGRLLDPEGSAFLVVPIAVYGAIAVVASLNIGLRHILPLYPFVIMLAAVAAEAIFQSWPRRAPLAIGTLLAVAALEFGANYPHNLAFFNVVAGGRHNGLHYLADSNVDWGQDLKPLKAWMDRQGVDQIGLAYFGTADPAYYGIKHRYLWGTTVPGVSPAMMGPPALPGYVAVSATLLDGVPFGEGERQFYKPLRDRPPAADIGGSIRVYWVDKPWWKE